MKDYNCCALCGTFSCDCGEIQERGFGRMRKEITEGLVPAMLYFVFLGAYTLGKELLRVLF